MQYRYFSPVCLIFYFTKCGYLGGYFASHQHRQERRIHTPTHDSPLDWLVPSIPLLKLYRENPKSFQINRVFVSKNTLNVVPVTFLQSFYTFTYHCFQVVRLVLQTMYQDEPPRPPAEPLSVVCTVKFWCWCGRLHLMIKIIFLTIYCFVTSTQKISNIEWIFWKYSIATNSHISVIIP